MKSPIFIDTGYILALLNTADAHHDRAVVASRQVKPPFLTTEAVLTEIGNALSRVRWRALGYATIQDFRADSNIEVVPLDAALFERALTLYGARMDQGMGPDRLRVFRRHAGAQSDASTDNRPALQSGRIR